MLSLIAIGPPSVIRRCCTVYSIHALGQATRTLRGVDRQCDAAAHRAVELDRDLDRAPREIRESRRQSDNQSSG
jgi:hypothetical protein